LPQPPSPPPSPTPPPVEFDVDPQLADNEEWEVVAQAAAIEAFVADEFVKLERQTRADNAAAAEESCLRLQAQREDLGERQHAEELQRRSRAEDL
jgi:hypothetical protein